MERQKFRFSPMAMSIVFMLCSIFSILMMSPSKVFAAGEITGSINTLYANEKAITLKASPSNPNNTLVFIGSNTTPEVIPDLHQWQTPDASGGYNLSGFSVFGGSETAPVNSTSITMEGGKVGFIYGGGYGQSVNGDTNVTINGGDITYDVYGGGEGMIEPVTYIQKGAPVTGSTNITINGGQLNTVYGGGNYVGSTVGSANIILNGGIIKNVWAGGKQGGMGPMSVTGLALIRKGVGASVSGSIKANSDGGWSMGPRSIQYEVAFYDGTTKLTTPASQWVEMGIADSGKTPTTGTATAPVNPADSEGKTFIRWEDASENEYTFGTINAPQKVYASWEYTAIYKGNGSNGGAVPADTAVYLKGDTVTLPGNTGNLAKTGYTFGGWSTTPGGTAITSYTIDSAAPIFYAVWNPIPTYAVTYNGNGSTGGAVPTDSTKYLAGAAVTLPGNTGNLTKTGYTFGGWSTTAGGTAITSYTMGTTPMTFYAVWTAAPADNNSNNNSSNSSGTSTTTSRAPSLEANSGTGQTISGALEAAASGSTVEVNMNDSTMLQADWLKAIAGRDVNLVLDMGNGVKWTINGKSVTGTNFSSVDLQVSFNTNTVPGSVLNNLTGERKAIQFTVTHSGNFSFTATLSTNLGKENKGLYANLYYYNETTKKLEFQSACKIGEDGSAAWDFGHTSSYAVVIDKVSLAGTELSAGASAEDSAPASEPAVDRHWGLAALAIIISAIFVLGVIGIQKRRAK